MTQYAKRSLPASRIVLLAAVLALAVAIGITIFRDGGTAAESAAPESSGAASRPSIETLESNARSNPGDPTAWAALGLAYFDAGRFAQAAGAYDKASRIDPQDAALWSALGEARVMASERDPMPGAAAAAFERALALDPADPRARYFLAVKKDLSGDHQGAIGDWLDLLEDTPAEAPWRKDLIRTVQQVGKINGIDVAQRLAEAGSKSPPAPAMPLAARAIPGPSGEDLAAAARIPPGEQREMAEGMVSRLETRLRGDPRNLDGWVMLMRSRMALGQPEKASQALKDALAANPDKSAQLRQQADVLGVR